MRPPDKATAMKTCRSAEEEEMNTGIRWRASRRMQPFRQRLLWQVCIAVDLSV